MMLAKKDNPKLNSKTPQWFKDWHAYHYFPFRQEFKLYKALQWVILGAIICAMVANYCLR